MKLRSLAFAIAAVLLLAACSGGTPAAPAPTAGGSQPAPAPQEDGKLVLSTFGFGADKVQKYVIEPFQQKYNVKVEVETGLNADRLNKLRANKAAPVVDVVMITDYFAQLGINEGLFEPIDPAQIPNLAKLYDFAPNKGNYGPIYTVNRLGIAYRTDKVSNPPTSWKDLWRPELKGVLGMPNLTISYGMPFLGAIAGTFGKDDTDMDAAFNALKQVKPNVLKFFSNTAELTSLMQRGEVVMAPAGDIFVIDLMKGGQPVKWVVPKEGAYLISNTVQVVKGTKRKATAQKFIDFLLSKEVQETAAAQWYDAPVNKEAKLDPSVAQYLAYGSESFRNSKTLDQSLVLKNRDAWLDRFMKEIAQ